MKDVSKILLALVVGAAAGAIAGVLLAPEDGAKTREKLAKKARKMEKKVREKAKDFKEKAKEYKEKAEGYVTKATDLKNDLVKKAEGFL